MGKHKEITEYERHKIFELRANGFSMAKIAKEIGTYESKIRYILVPNSKEKYMACKKRWQEKNKSKTVKYTQKNRANFNADTLYAQRIMGAFGRRVRKGEINKHQLVNDFFQKFGRKEYYTCYLTGQTVPASKISLDHISPYTNGMDDNMDNIDITFWEINDMKGRLPLERFIELCKMVASHNE